MTDDELPLDQRSDLEVVAKALRWHVAPIRKVDERPYMDALAALRRLEEQK